MYSEKLENNKDLVKIASVEIQVGAPLDNSNKIKLVVPDGRKCIAVAELTKKQVQLLKIIFRVQK